MLQHMDQAPWLTRSGEMILASLESQLSSIPWNVPKTSRACLESLICCANIVWSAKRGQGMKQSKERWRREQDWLCQLRHHCFQLWLVVSLFFSTAILFPVSCDGLSLFILCAGDDLYMLLVDFCHSVSTLSGCIQWEIGYSHFPPHLHFSILYISQRSSNGFMAL